MEIRINKEIREYTENMFFGLSMRQFIFSVVACGAAVGIYFVSSVVYRHIKTYVSSTGWKLTRRLSNYGH